MEQQYQKPEEVAAFFIIFLIGFFIYVMSGKKHKNTEDNDDLEGCC
jgi:hypothetical protein